MSEYAARCSVCPIYWHGVRVSENDGLHPAWKLSHWVAEMKDFYAFHREGCTEGDFPSPPCPDSTIVWARDGEPWEPKP